MCIRDRSRVYSLVFLHQLDIIIIFGFSSVSTQQTSKKPPPSQHLTLESLDKNDHSTQKDEHDDDFIEDPKYKLSLKMVDKDKELPLTQTSRKLRPYALRVLDQSNYQKKYPILSYTGHSSY